VVQHVLRLDDVAPFTSRFAELWRTSLEATAVSCHPYPMSTSLRSDSDLEPIVFEWTPEQMQILVQTAAGARCGPELEPLPIEGLTDPLPLPLHQAISPEGEETEALESDAAPLPPSQESSLGSNEQSRKPPRTGRVGLLVRVLIHVGLLVGITYVRQIGEEPIQVAQEVDPEPARVGEDRAPTAPSVDSEVVRIKNPFDRTEVFEFPPGTSKAEAREAIAKLLLERAHDRLPLLAEASRRRGATAKHGTHESSQLQDSQY
jgi:hypothetical protein